MKQAIKENGENGDNLFQIQHKKLNYYELKEKLGEGFINALQQRNIELKYKFNKDEEDSIVFRELLAAKEGEYVLISLFNQCFNGGEIYFSSIDKLNTKIPDKIQGFYQKIDKIEEQMDKALDFCFFYNLFYYCIGVAFSFSVIGIIGLVLSQKKNKEKIQDQNRDCE